MYNIDFNQVSAGLFFRDFTEMCVTAIIIAKLKICAEENKYDGGGANLRLKCRFLVVRTPWVVTFQNV
jgi:hypothetical protein